MKRRWLQATVLALVAVCPLVVAWSAIFRSATIASSRASEGGQLACGHWCIYRCCWMLGAPVDMEEVVELLPPNPRGHSLAELRDALQRIGLQAMGCKESFDAFCQGEFPCIVQLDNPEHFVVAAAPFRGRSGLLVFDGSGARRRVPEDAVRRRWTGNVLRLRRNAAAGHAEVVNLAKAVNRDAYARLYYDRDPPGPGGPNDIFEPDQGEVLLHATAWFGGIAVSGELEVWRKLHVEVDSMGVVAGNTLVLTADGVTQVDPTTFRIHVTEIGQLEVNRFERGTLQDSDGTVYEIVENDLDSVTVRLGGNLNPPALGIAWLQDDDFLRDGWDVPMPNTDALESAMRQVYVQVHYDVGDHNSDVSFVLNAAETDGSGASLLPGYMDWDSKPMNSPAYWVAYVLGAFQPGKDVDFDPDTQRGNLGVADMFSTTSYGGSLVFLESIREYARLANRDPVALEMETVVHEIGHLAGNTGDYVWVGTEWVPVAVTRPDEPLLYTEDFQYFIRRSAKPYG